MRTLTIPKDYGYVLLGLVGTAFHCTTQAFFVGRSRDKHLTKEWVQENLKEENEVFKKKYGYDISKGAYPDMTDGRHMSKLDYSTWLEYSCAQRAHQNYVEGLPLALTTGAIAGLHFPRFAAGALLANIIGRQLYCSGYRNDGPEGRLRGVWFNFAVFANLCASVVTSVKLSPLGALSA